MTMKTATYTQKALTVLSLLAGLPAVFADQKPCTAVSCMNSYDLSPLSASTDYTFTSHSGRNFTLNVCRSVVSEMWNPKVDHLENVGGFVRGAHGDISIGEANTTLHIRDGNPYLLLENGSSCPQSDAIKSSSIIRFMCDKNADEGTPQLLAQLPPEDDDACAFVIEWKTKYACPLPQHYAVWKIILTTIVIILALLLTLVALLFLTSLLRRRRRSSHGLPSVLDDTPRSWFGALSENLRDLGRLLRGQDPWGHPNGYANGTAAQHLGNGSAASSGSTGWGWKPSFSLPLPFGRRGGRDRRNFSRLPQNAEEESMMGNGRFSLEDDEDEHTGANGVAGEYDGAEESAAWSAQRLRGMDSAGVIRL